MVKLAKRESLFPRNVQIIANRESLLQKTKKNKKNMIKRNEFFTSEFVPTFDKSILDPWGLTKTENFAMYSFSFKIYKLLCLIQSKTRMTPVMNFCGFHGRVNSRRKQNYNRVQKYLEELKFITKIDTTRKVLSFSLSFQTV